LAKTALDRIFVGHCFKTYHIMKQILFLLILFLAMLAPQRSNAVTIQVDSLVHERCYGELNGAIYITVLTDTFYSVTWINVAWHQLSGIDAIGLGAGTYEVRAHAADGTSQTLFITIAEPPPLVIEVLEQYPPDCRGQDGFITVQATGGTPGSAGYAYDWGNGNHGTSQVIPFPGDSYDLFVTDDNGCVSSIYLNALPEYYYFRMDSNALRQINCYNRTLWIKEDEPNRPISEGLKRYPLSYHWMASNGGHILTDPDSAAILVDAAGRYRIQVTNEANGCVTEALAIVTVDTLAPFADAGANQVLPCVNSTDTLFGIIGGPIDVVTNGYWEGSCVISNLPDAAVLIGGPGTYILKAFNTDNGCTATDTTEVISSHNNPTVSTTGGIIGCLSEITTLTAVFDTVNTRFDGWFLADTLYSTAVTLVLTEPITLLVEVTDTLTGCTGSTYANVFVDTLPPYLEFTSDSLFCATPLVQILLDDNFAAPADSILYGFFWTGPRGFASNLAQPWVAAAGTYTLELTYLPSGCKNTLAVELLSDDLEPPILNLKNATIYLDEPGLAVLLPEQIDAGSTDACGSILAWSMDPVILDCAYLGEHSVILTASDQNGNSATGTVLVTVLDTISPKISCPDNLVRGYCDSLVIFNMPVGMDNCQTTVTQESGLPSGTPFPVGATEQTFVAKDGSGNSAHCSFTVTVLPPVEEVTFLPTSPSCVGVCDGQLLLETVGGTPPFQYLWNTGDTNNMLINTCAGNHELTLTDQMGCTSSWVSTLSEPLPLILLVDTIRNDQNTQGVGAIDITPGGGTAPYQFEWLLNGAFFSNAADLNGLFAGTYTCNLQDANQCTLVVRNLVVDNLVETKEHGWSKTLRLFPNPTTGLAQFQLPDGLTHPPTVRVIDGTGRILQATIAPKEPSIWALDLSNLPQGLYQVQVIIEGQIATLPLLKINPNH
jgi:hypothetical protein